MIWLYGLVALAVAYVLIRAQRHRDEALCVVLLSAILGVIWPMTMLALAAWWLLHRESNKRRVEDLEWVLSLRKEES